MEVTMSYTSGIGGGQVLPTSISTPETSLRSQSSGGAQNVASASERDVAVSDQTTFSAAGSWIAQPVAGGDSDVRTEKVAALQQAIAAGTYNVSASDVADKLIQASAK
jgi:negative regulator of flagellin synthesis FlgM